MSQPFRIAQGDLTAQGIYSEPAFAVFRDTSSLAKIMYDALNSFGLRLADIKFERGNGSLAELHLLCSLPSLSVSIQVRVDRVDILCFDTIRSNQEQFVSVAQKTLEAVGATAANKNYRSYALLGNLHGTVEGTTPVEYLLKITGAGPTKLGPLLGSGAVFYYGPDADRLSSFLSVDLSGLRGDAVYVRPYAVWDAAKTSLGDLPTLAENFMRLAFESIGLDWPILPPQ